MASDDQKGYDCQFVDPAPDSLVCLICTSVARDPQQTVCCGKIYCKACLSDLKSSYKDARCPQCRKMINSFPDTRGNFRNIIRGVDNTLGGGGVNTCLARKFLSVKLNHPTLVSQLHDTMSTILFYY